LGRRRVIVLDTHVWIWWTSSPSSLSKRARAALERDDELLVPAICCWEVGMLVAKKRLELDREQRRARALHGTRRRRVVRRHAQRRASRASPEN
jgi:PIN domain nuclease of toxin-antitoxin system